MHDIKLILCDIDDTILPHLPEGTPKTVSARTIAAFHSALDAGMHVGCASGRGFTWLPGFFGGDAACCATSLATNGLQVYVDGQLIHEEVLRREDLEALLAVVREVPGAGLVCFDGLTPHLVAGTREVLSESFPAYAQKAVDADGVPDFPVIKANVFAHGGFAGSKPLADLINSRVPTLHVDYACPGYSNVMPQGYDKGSGVLEICRQLGIGTDQVIVFGDANNDLPMFRVVENSVAVANATPDAAEAARWHIGLCKDDAVAAAIEALAAGEWPFER